MMYGVIPSSHFRRMCARPRAYEQTSLGRGVRFTLPRSPADRQGFARWSCDLQVGERKAWLSFSPPGSVAPRLGRGSLVAAYCTRLLSRPADTPDAEQVPPVGWCQLKVDSWGTAQLMGFIQNIFASGGLTTCCVTHLLRIDSEAPRSLDSDCRFGIGILEYCSQLGMYACIHAVRGMCDQQSICHDTEGLGLAAALNPKSWVCHVLHPPKKGPRYARNAGHQCRYRTCLNFGNTQ